MQRREFVGLIGAAAVSWPLAARTQPGDRVARIGYISFVSAARSRDNDNEFRAGLRDLGYVEGKNLLIEFRSAEEDESKIPALVSELIVLKVDVIVTQASGVFAAMRASKTIPIVMAV